MAQLKAGTTVGGNPVLHTGNISSYIPSGPEGKPGQPGTGDVALANLILNGIVQTTADDFTGLTIGSTIQTGLFTQPWSTGTLSIAPQSKFTAGKGYLYSGGTSAARRVVTYDEYGDISSGILRQSFVLSNAQTNEAFITMLAKISGGVGTETGVFGQLSITTNQLKLMSYTNGVANTLKPAINMSLTQNTLYWMEMAWSDTWYAIKAWKDGDTEPSNYQLEISDYKLITTGGKCGVMVRTGDLYLGPRTIKRGYKNLNKAPTDQPRGSGGTVGRITSRAADSAVRTDVLPSDAADKFSAGRVAFIDADNKVVGRGQTGRVTGITGFTAGKRYYVDFPANSTAPNLTAVPDPAPDGFPDTSIWNVNRNYYLAGECFTDGSDLFFTHYSDATVALTDLTVPNTYFDVSTMPYNTQLIGNGITRMVQMTGATASPLLLLADNDAGVPAGPTSPVQASISGISKPVFIRHQAYGQHDLVYPTAMQPQLGGEVLLRFAVDATNWDNVKPTIFFGGSGSAVAGTPGVYHAVQCYGTSSYNCIKVTLNGNTQASEARQGGVNASTGGVAYTSTDYWYMRVKVDGVNKLVYARVWKSTATEPTTWGLNAIPVPDLVSGYWGWRLKDGYVRITGFAIAGEGGSAIYA